MRLVNTPTARLGAEGGKALMAYIEASLRKDERYFNFMSNLRNLLSGKHWDNVRKDRLKDELRLVINLAHSHVHSLVPTLFFKNPTLDCYPTHPRHAGKETTWNGVMNGTWDKIGFKKEFKAAVLDAVTYPEAVIKHVINRPPDSAGRGADTETGVSGPVEWLTKGSPVHVRQNPRQLLVDYRVKDRDITKARYIVFRYRRPKQELLAHPLYGKNIEDRSMTEEVPNTGNLVGVNVEEGKDDWDISDVYRSSEDTLEHLTTIYEVWIHQLIDSGGKFKCYQQMCVLMEDQDKPILELTNWDEKMGEGFTSFPATRIVLLPIPDHPPNSELGAWQDLQMAANWLFSRVTQLVENDRQIYLVDPAKIKNFEKFKKAFYGGRSRTLAEVNDLNGAMELVQPTFVGRDNYQLLAIVQNFQREVAGIGQNRRGGSGIRTASEAHIIEQGTQIKTDEKVDVISDALIDIATKAATMIMSLVKSDLGTQWVFRVGGDIGAVNWLNFNAEDLNWLPDIRIRVNSFRKADTLIDMQKYAGLITIGIQLAQMGMPIRVDELYSRMLESSGITDPSKIVGSHDQEYIVQVVEIGAMIGGIQIPAKDGENHPAHMQAIEAFRQSQIGQVIVSRIPEFADALDQHYVMHEQLLQVQQQRTSVSQTTAQNPFAGISAGGTPQSEANLETASSRTAASPIPGGQGEFA